MIRQLIRFFWFAIRKEISKSYDSRKIQNCILW